MSIFDFLLSLLPEPRTPEEQQRHEDVALRGEVVDLGAGTPSILDDGPFVPGDYQASDDSDREARRREEEEDDDRRREEEREAEEARVNAIITAYEYGRADRMKGKLL